MALRRICRSAIVVLRFGISLWPDVDKPRSKELIDCDFLYMPTVLMAFCLAQ
jgi:hypothetical protein